MAKRRATVKRKRGMTRQERLRATGGWDMLVDGGMMSFMVAVNLFGASWYDVRDDYRESLIINDDRTARKDFYPEYKSGRKVKRDADPKKAEGYKRVREFRNYLKTDNTVNVIQLPSCEADDLIVALSYRFPDAKLQATDKDISVAPGCFNRMWNFKGEKPSPLWAKLPKYQQNVKLAPGALYLLQSLTGDKTDSIPRLLPSRSAKPIWEDAYDPQDTLQSYWNFYEIYGDDLLRNLNLVLIPTPLLLDEPFKNLDDYFGSLVDGSFWLGGRFEKLCDRAMASMDTMGTVDEDIEAFSWG